MVNKTREKALISDRMDLIRKALKQRNGWYVPEIHEKYVYDEL